MLSVPRHCKSAKSCGWTVWVFYTIILYGRVLHLVKWDLLQCKVVSWADFVCIPTCVAAIFIVSISLVIYCIVRLSRQWHRVLDRHGPEQNIPGQTWSDLEGRHHHYRHQPRGRHRCRLDRWLVSLLPRCSGSITKGCQVGIDWWKCSLYRHWCVCFDFNLWTY